MFNSRFGIAVAVSIAAASLIVTQALLAEELPKPASDSTRAVHAQVLKDLPFAGERDLGVGARGLVAPLPDGGVVRNDRDAVIWDPRQYDFVKLDQAAPETVNPSLWRQAQLLTLSGLFKVTDQIYQVRGYDLANITFIEGRDGIVVVDPLMKVGTARASLEWYFQHRPKKPGAAVHYTHSH